MNEKDQDFFMQELEKVPPRVSSTFLLVLSSRSLYSSTISERQARQSQCNLDSSSEVFSI
jgi:hypothetical protein